MSASAMSFHQAGPELRNTYRHDDLLRGLLHRALSADALRAAEPQLERMGARAVTDLARLGDAAEAAPPRLVPYDAWGSRIDRIETAGAWKTLHAIACEEGLIATAYERRYGPHSRLVQFALLYLFHPSTAFASCPLAMSDGAARVLELAASEAIRNRALAHLLTRDPRQFWTSGQWMTERTGGSDVSGTTTVARPDAGAFRLFGTKWFSSATTSEMALTLARIEGAPAGSGGLSLFYLETQAPAGGLNGIRILRLKDKLGTRALPTAELELDGTVAQLVGSAGEGVRTIATMLNVTRLYNAACAAATVRRAADLARDYAARRIALGKPLNAHPLHRATVAALEVEARAALVLTWRAAELLGREECGVASADERKMLRLLTPIAKLSTAKQAVAVASEALECFGGAGYVEDTGLPRLLRDAQVLPIWEGTTNVLALDVERVIAASADALAILLDDLDRRTRDLPPPLEEACLRWRADAAALVAARAEALAAGEETAQAAARVGALELARLAAGALLLEHAAYEIKTQEIAPTAAAARLWCARRGAMRTERTADLRLLSSVYL
jgi:alkylation response protein AidB-like acyl-CoA dehydrogenase